MTHPNRTDEQALAARPADPGGWQDPAGQGPKGPPGRRPVHRTRLGGAWVTLAVGALILIVLLVFILENLQRVDISFFGAHGHLPLGVAMLLAAVAAVLIVVIPGTGRIVQLRRTARRHAKAAAAARSTETGTQPRLGGR